MRRLAFACTLLHLLRHASAATAVPLRLQQGGPFTSGGEPVVAHPLHVSAGGCMLAHRPRSAVNQQLLSPPTVHLHGSSLLKCSVADFSVRLAIAGSASAAACGGILPHLKEHTWVQPRWLVQSSCRHDAMITVQPQVMSGVRRALRQLNDARGVNTSSCSGPSCKVFILLIVTFGVIFGAIVTASVITKCGPCKFCWWAWQHRHDPPEVAAHHAHIASKGDPVVAAQLISEVVAPCSSAHMDKLGREECPVCLQSEGEWSLLPCGHAVCSPCLAQLIKAQAMVTTCPLCRDPLLPDAEEHQAAGSSAGSSAGTISARSSALSRASTLSRSSSEAAGSSSGGGGGGLSPRLSRAMGLVRSSPQPSAGSQCGSATAACSSHSSGSGAAPSADAKAAAGAPASVQLTIIAEAPADVSAASASAPPPRA